MSHKKRNKSSYAQPGQYNPTGASMTRYYQIRRKSQRATLIEVTNQLGVELYTTEN